MMQVKSTRLHFVGVKPKKAFKAKRNHRNLVLEHPQHRVEGMVVIKKRETPALVKAGLKSH